MAFIDYARRSIACKIVYWGPEGSGKTTNVQYAWEKTRTGQGTFVKSDAQGPSYEYLPLSLGDIRGFKTEMHMYAVPGDTGYSAARLALLKGVDGIVFVADSSPVRLQA